MKSTSATGGRNGSGSSANGYYWALAGIFFYHSLQVFFLPTNYDACGHSYHGPDPFSLLRGGGAAVTAEPGVRKALSEFIPPDHVNVKRPDHNCTRWNTTYVFPQAPSFISKCVLDVAEDNGCDASSC
jgi:hypothetical protein